MLWKVIGNQIELNSNYLLAREKDNSITSWLQPEDKDKPTLK